MTKISSLRLSLLTAATALGATMMSGNAFASPTAYDILGNFNLVTVSNFTTTAEVEGAMLIGGNVSGGSTQLDKNNAVVGSPFTGYGGVNVVGNISGGYYNESSSSVFRIGGSSTASYNPQGSNAPTVSTNYRGWSPSPGSLITTLTNFSSSLSTLATTAGASLVDGQGGNNPILTAGTGSNGVAVLDITASQLMGYKGGLQLNLGSVGALIINVSGSFTSPGNLSYGSLASSARDIIWNFYDAKDVNFTTGFEGTVLAPNATFENASAVEGSVFVNSVNANGEIHNLLFNGTQLTTTGIPEPNAAAVLLFGIVGLGLIQLGRSRLV